MREPPAQGYPVVVFLHGLSFSSRMYGSLGEALVTAGFIGVFSDTARFDSIQQRADAAALFEALGVANSDPDSPLFGRIDLERMGLAGHSMGGGSTIHVLAENPGYRAGFCFAPGRGRRSFAASAPRVSVPIGIVHGRRDRILPFERTSTSTMSIPTLFTVTFDISFL